MAEYKLSVIIPIYNAQNTIKRCIDSVINQTIGFENIELILYDDCSTDNTREILKQYANKYSNINLCLSNKNSGYPGKGRNEGIKIAMTDYIMFIDSDDEYKKDICETLYNEIIMENADIVSCSFEQIDKISIEVWGSSYRGGVSKNNKLIFNGDEVLNYRDCFVWDKIFKKSLITQNHIKFPEIQSNEDLYFMYLLYFHVDKIIYLKEYVGYRKHGFEDSVSVTLDIDGAKERIVSTRELIRIYKDNNVKTDYSFHFYPIIGNVISHSYLSGKLTENNEIKELFKYIYSFQKEFNFDESHLGMLLVKLQIRLIMKRRWTLAIMYFKIAGVFSRSNLLRRIYRAI